MEIEKESNNSLIYAGSAQFIASSMILSNASIAALLTDETFLVASAEGVNR